jgi:hypothetical protein
LRELSVLVPVPGHEQAAMVTLSTPYLEDWDVYEKLVLDICRSMHVQQTPTPTSSVNPPTRQVSCAESPGLVRRQPSLAGRGAIVGDSGCNNWRVRAQFLASRGQ